MEIMDSNIDIQIEDSDIHSKFAHILKDFRLKFGTKDLNSIAEGFKHITFEKIKKYVDESTDDIENENVLKNWILECKFWTLLESLLDIKFSTNLLNIETNNSKTNNNICEYSSDTIIQDDIISSDTELLQLFTYINTLSDTFKLDCIIDIEEGNGEGANENNNSPDLSNKKWLNTLMDLNSVNVDSSLVKHLDIDAPNRENLNINAKDLQNDEVFFKMIYKHLLSKNYEEIKQLCKDTNNWDFALIIESLNNRIDPILDLNDFTYKTTPSGVKSKILRRRIIYQLCTNDSDNANTNKMGIYEKACYGILSSDLLSCNEIINEWDEKLYLYLDNLLKDKLEAKILNNYSNLDLEIITKFPKPPLMSNSINEILNKLSNDSNTKIRNQSEHPIRVLIGSIISNNVKNLMNNTINSINLLKDNLTNDEKLNELTNESYLLRILTHLSIILQLIYGENIINNEDYTKLIHFYILRLILYKKYELIPIYISFIPNIDELIEIYSKLLFQFEYLPNDRYLQIKNIRNLSLPLEDILRKTIEFGFNETIDYYPVKKEVELTYKVDKIDIKLYSTIYWFIDSGMIIDCLESIIILLRRFLLVGKIGSAIEFLNTISLPNLIDDYKLKKSMSENDCVDDDTNESENFTILEIIQYHNLFKAFKLITSIDVDEDGNDKIMEIYELLNNLLKIWLFDLVNDENVKESDIEIFKELRRIYIPSIFNTLFDLLIKNGLNDLAIDLINLLADEKYQLYEIFVSTNELEEFLIKFANFNCYIDNVL